MGELTGSAVREARSYRADAAVPAFPDDKPIIVFDGNCVLCSRFRAWLKPEPSDADRFLG